MNTESDPENFDTEPRVEDQDDASETEDSISSYEIQDHAPVSEEPVRQRRKIYLNTHCLPEPDDAYVCWLDVMGSKNAMSRSLLQSANNIGRLHIAILMNKDRNLQISPFMDGAYVRSYNQRPMLNFLWKTMEELAFEFVNAAEHRHRFMPRGGISFGSIIQGINIPTTVSKILGAYSNSSYREGIYFGYPMVQAFQSEGHAPPFGIAINESARSFSPPHDRPLSGTWFRWHLYREVDFLDELVSTLKDYFDWCERHSHGTGYPKDRIRVHREMAEEYFDH